MTREFQAAQEGAPSIFDGTLATRHEGSRLVVTIPLDRMPPDVTEIEWVLA